MPLLEGPIAVTGASGHVGRLLQRRLEELPNEVRPLGRGDDPGRAFRDADAVVHLAGALQPLKPNTYEAANLATVRETVLGLEGSAVKRVVFLSYVGADSGSPNEYLRTKGRAEELLRACGKPVVIFRCTYIVGPPDDPGPTASSFLAHGGKPVSVIGDGTQLVAPVYAGDVVEAIVRAALDPSTPTGTFDLAGPSTLTLDELVETLNGGRVRERHFPPLVSRAVAHLVPALTPALVDVLLRDSLARDTSAVEAFGLELRRLRDVYSAVAVA